MGRLLRYLKGIKGQLFLASLIPLIGFVIVFTVSFLGLSSVNKVADDVFERMYPNAVTIGQMRELRSSIGYYSWAILSDQNSEAQTKHYKIKLQEAVDDFKNKRKHYEELPFSEGELQLYKENSAQKKFEDFESVTAALIEKVNTENQEQEKLNHEQAILMITEGSWSKASNDVQKYLLQVLELQESEAKHERELLSENYVNIITNIIGASVIAFITTFVFLTFTGIKISNSVNKSNNEIKLASSQVNAAIEQLSAAGQSLSQSSTASAASLEETVASLEEVTSMVEMNNENAKQAALLAQSSRSSAEKGEQEIRVLVSQMQEIAYSSKKIEEIINVIDDIAFQTNLLALNAAVEAARAGDQGKGFAVVADAVRSLAQRSASAAKDINSLIRQSVEKIDQGVIVADRSGTVMNEILNSVKKVADLANEISTASSEQASGVQQISKAMNQLDHGSQENAAASEEIASTAEEISSQSSVMISLIDNLNAVVNGDVKAS